MSPEERGVPWLAFVRRGPDQPQTRAVGQHPHQLAAHRAGKDVPVEEVVITRRGTIDN